MVMKRKNMMRRNLQQTIRKSAGRYLAIVAIIALGAGLFCGLRVTKVDMVATVQEFTDRQNMFDLQLLNPFGWTEDNVSAISSVPGIGDAEGGISLDVMLRMDDDKDKAYKLISIPESVNQVSLVEGRMPSAPNECLADNFFNNSSIIGQEIHVSDANDSDTRERLAYDSYTVVGLAATPLYLNMQRGSTSIGTGSISNYFYIPQDGFSLDFFTEINLTLSGDYQVYTDEYDQAMDDMAEHLKSVCSPMADHRRTDILSQAEAEYADGLSQYEDGCREFEASKGDALQQLADAEQQLKDGEAELLQNQQLLENGKQQISDALMEIAKNREALRLGWEQLKTEKSSAYAELDRAESDLDRNSAQITIGLNQVNAGLSQFQSGLTQIDDGLTQLDTAIAQIDEGLAQIRDGLDQIDSAIVQLEDGIPKIDDGLAKLEQTLPLLNAAADISQKILDYLKENPNPDLPEIPNLPEIPGLPNPDQPDFIDQLKIRLQQVIDQRNAAVSKQQELIQTRAEMISQLEAARTQREALLAEQAELEQKRAALSSQRDDLQAQKNDLMPQYQSLLAAKQELESSKSAVDSGYQQLAARREEADRAFSEVEVELQNGEQQLTDAQNLVHQKQLELQENEQLLNDARQQIDDGRAKYESEKASALQKIEDAQAELDAAGADLSEARSKIDSIGKASLYILTRNTNPGYVVFESDSDIIAGVAKIFPVFFLSVAALVCITTMTRMVDEERTQIGILKALGYSSFSIMGKYMAYSGSAALIGCAAGVIAGSIIFPKILWKAYCIMYGFDPSITLTFDWGTCAAIVLSYTALTLFVTWYCCHRELSNVPAELIRPKSPTAGKKLFLEKLLFWRKLSFLNKVAIRNIFRYHQRLAMMLLGIGGCTALLVTGFGIKDSISGIVDYQFESVTHYDQAVTFEEIQTPQLQQQFHAAFDEVSEGILFCHQSSIDLSFEDQTKNITFLVSDEPLEPFMSLHSGEQILPMPDNGEVLLSVGVAEVLGIEKGDQIVLRSSDLKQLHLTVSGIFDNHVYNYAIVSGDTLRSQWGQEPEIKSAFVLQTPDSDVHEVGAAISGYDGVLNVLVNQDTADQVYSMMDAMDSIVLLVVFCAGLLATIVLYNLTNINIKERIREIATIKVLGFNARETGSYVFKENLALTFMGMILGLAGGKLLHAAVMSFVRIDMVWFDSIVKPTSYLMAALLTIAAALAVDFVMYFQLNKINMAEALKSVE